MSMITATAWVPRGRAAQFPTKYEFDEEEYDRISRLARLQLDDAKDELEEARATAGKATERSNGAKEKVAVIHNNGSVSRRQEGGRESAAADMEVAGMLTTTMKTTTMI